VPLLAKIPLSADLRGGGDVGTPIVVSDPDSPAGAALLEAARELARTSRSRIGRPIQLGVAGNGGGGHGHQDHAGHAHAAHEHSH
jgi:ATP-binding protein involved in chromosome partitioning